MGDLHQSLKLPPNFHSTPGHDGGHPRPDRITQLKVLGGKITSYRQMLLSERKHLQFGFGTMPSDVSLEQENKGFRWNSHFGERDL